MTDAETWLRGIAADLRIGVLFATRIPLPHATPVEGADVARASWTLPVVGALIGLLGASAYRLAFALNLPPLIGAALAVTTTLFVTGALHEDGLADTLDGFGGGGDRERKLEIMRDSRIGTYGACGLVLSLFLRVGALASLAGPGPAALTLIAAHAGARAAMPLFLALVPPARPDGLSAGAGRCCWASSFCLRASAPPDRSSRCSCCWAGSPSCAGCACARSAARPAMWPARWSRSARS